MSKVFGTKLEAPEKDTALTPFGSAMLSAFNVACIEPPDRWEVRQESDDLAETHRQTVRITEAVENKGDDE